MLRLNRPAALMMSLALVVTISCAKESNDDSAVARDKADKSGSESDKTTGSSDGGKLNWEDCGGDQCAKLKVPLDYAQPSGDKITLSITRVPATGKRTGALFVNPGGPGATASDFASQIAPALPPNVTEHFDIVGVDPRGTGASAINCGEDFTDLYSVDYSLDSPEDETTLLDVSKQYTDRCQRTEGKELAHLGTRDVARDMDTVRAAMGDDQLSYLGFSYGTAIGQMYADMFPKKVRAMVLDGVLELGPTGLQLAEEQARGFEKALNSFADDCNTRTTCPIAPDAIAKINELTAKVEKAPLPGGSRELTPGLLAIGLALPLYSEPLWPQLAEAVDAGLKGDGGPMLSLARQYLEIGSFDIYFAVNCLDFSWPTQPKELLADGAKTDKDAPHFGSSIVNDYVRCTMWPAKQDPLPAVKAPGTPPIVVISTTNDPATPYEGGVHTAERLESGVLVTHKGDGHTVVGTGVSCIDDMVAKYLVDLKPPENGLTC